VNVESCDEELIYEELIISYRELYNRSEKNMQAIRKAEKGHQSTTC